MSQETAEPRWYVVYTYSGYENKVMETIQTKARNLDMTDMVLDVRIPMTKETEEVVKEVVEEIPDPDDPDNPDKVIRRTRETKVQKVHDVKTFPGYVLVYMIHTDETAHLVRSIRGVTGFLGAEVNHPTPLTDEEVEEMGIDVVRKEFISSISVGDSVHISNAGGSNASFNGIHGTVTGIDTEAKTCRVRILFFDREIEIEFPLENVISDS